MKLTNLKIEGFRRHQSTEIVASSATFLIGENNVGKSSVLKALECLLSDTKQISPSEFYRNDKESLDSPVIITGEFSDLPQDCLEWRGFRGRVFPYTASGETKYRIFFRKTFFEGKPYHVEMKEYPKSVKPQFTNCVTLKDYIDNGLCAGNINELFPKADLNKKLTAKDKEKFSDLEDVYDWNSCAEEIWVSNPGGIPGNVLSKLPKVLIIPAVDRQEELDGNSGTLKKALSELFDEVRETSVNFKEAEKHLKLLAQELDPHNEESEFGKMMGELNAVLSSVFPNTGIHTAAYLSDPNSAIKPTFTIRMSSNVETEVGLQGTGSIRAAVFALLRYRSERTAKAKDSGPLRPLLIGFEEPELYLHPNAAEQMRETIYNLAQSNDTQIVCTTHSPYMIDLSRRPEQVLNLLAVISEESHTSIAKSYPFSISDAFRALQDDDKNHIKMLVKIDEYIARVFFTKNVLIVEGDTEEIVIKETLDRVCPETKKEITSDWAIIKARGKATIIPLVKYLVAMGISPHVMHDKDSSVAGAEKFNEPIATALGDADKVFQLEDCMEDLLGYPAPKSEKPYQAFKFIRENWNSINDVPEKWRKKFEDIFSISIPSD